MDVEDIALIDGFLEKRTRAYPSLRLDDPKKLMEAREVLSELVKNDQIPDEIGVVALKTLRDQEALQRQRHKPTNGRVSLDLRVSEQRYGAPEQTQRYLARRDIASLLERTEYYPDSFIEQEQHPVDRVIEIAKFVNALPPSLHLYLKMSNRDITLSDNWLIRLIFNKGERVCIQSYCDSGNLTHPALYTVYIESCFYGDFFIHEQLAPQKVGDFWANGSWQPTILNIARLSNREILEKILKAL